MAVIRSSGHSYIGRSTHDGSIVINLANMKGKKFNLNSIRNQAGEVTLESGNTWIDVYEEVRKKKKKKKERDRDRQGHTETETERVKDRQLRQTDIDKDRYRHRQTD